MHKLERRTRAADTSPQILGARKGKDLSIHRVGETEQDNTSSQETFAKRRIKKDEDGIGLVYTDDYSQGQANSTKNINQVVRANGKSMLKSGRPASSGSHALLHDEPSLVVKDNRRRVLR